MIFGRTPDHRPVQPQKRGLSGTAPAKKDWSKTGVPTAKAKDWSKKVDRVKDIKKAPTPRHLGIGIDIGLLVNPTDTFQGADIESVLRAQITRVGGIDLAARPSSSNFFFSSACT